MEDNNMSLLYFGKTSWKNAHYMSRIIVVVETPRSGHSPENIMKKVLNQMVLIFKLLFSLDAKFILLYLEVHLFLV